MAENKMAQMDGNKMKNENAENENAGMEEYLSWSEVLGRFDKNVDKNEEEEKGNQENLKY